MESELNIIKEKIYKTMRILNINRMPTSREVRSVKIPALDNDILKTGGYVEWANNLNLSMKKQIHKLSDDEIKERILQAINILGINRMPSRTEILSVENDEILHNAISKGYGYFKWAEKLGFKIKDSETLMGINYQVYCKKQLENMGYNVSDTTTIAPYDLLINNNIRIDVKSGSAYEIRGSRVHSFGINKKYPTCDLYTIYALDENGVNIERTLIIPSKYLKVISLCIGNNSKYNKYINRWDYLDIYDKFYNIIVS